MKDTLILTDPHGLLDKFNELLEKCYIPTQHQLILLGDYVDRGPNSRGMVKRVRELVENHGAVAIRGNHDDWFIRNALGQLEVDEYDMWFNQGGKETVQSYAGYDDMKEDAEWLDQHLKLYHEDDTCIYVHGGVVPNVPIEQQKPAQLMWSRYHGKCGLGKTIVHGHTPVKEVSQFHDQIYVDTGGVYGDKLSALLLPSGEIFEIPTPGRKL